VKVLAKSARCLSDEEIAGLATYIRNAWGNRAPVVSASHVAAIRNDITRKTAVKQAMGIDADFFALTVSPLELIIRGSLIYWFLFLIFRFVLRRNAGSLGVTDLLFIVLLGDAAQNAMIGDGTSVADGMTLIATLVAWNYLLDFLGARYKLVSRFTDPPRLTLFANGRKNRRNMRGQSITDEELDEKVRQQGIADLSGVEAAYLESNGEVSIVKKGDGK
jgi:hypothetical protein